MRLSDLLVKRTPYISLQIAVVVVLGFLLIQPPRYTEPVKNNPVSIPTQATTTEAATATPASTSTPPPSKSKPVTFSTIRLLAKAAIVYDTDSGEILYAKNSGSHLPIASITKVMTALTATTYLPANAVVTITPEDSAVESSAGITAGEQWPIRDLIAFTLVSSSNGGATAIARTTQEVTQKDFIEQMNNLAKEIGLTDSNFRNPTGLDIYSGQMSGSYSTALDVAKLFAYIDNNAPAVMAGTNQGTLTAYSLDSVSHHAVNTNLLLAKVPNIEMSKTGLTDLAGGSLAILFEPIPGRKIAVVVLGSTSQGRFGDMEQLAKATIASLKVENKL